MNFWFYLIILLALIWILDGWRLRGRARSLKVLPPGDEEPTADMHFILRRGANLDEATRRSAVAWAQAQSLDVLVLLPGDLPAAEALLTCQIIDPKTFRKARIASAKCSGEAILVRSAVLERFGQEFAPPTNSWEFARLAHDLKKYACTGMDIVVVPELRSSTRPWRQRGALVDFIFGGIAMPFLMLQLPLLLWAAWMIPKAGLAALIAYHVQPLLALHGRPFRSRHLERFVCFRLFYDFGTILGMFNLHRETRRKAIEERRPHYRELLSQGTGPFFEDPRDDCPICGSAQLKTAVSSRDLIQCKPGIFTISQCLACEHHFQNPRLSIAGLEFYYQDFYDGLGKDSMDRLFAHGSAPYLARASMLKGSSEPRRWLDVGAGHGHFCCMARDAWPHVTFDGLDMSQSVEDAYKRGWVDHAYRGLFPDLADGLARDGSYDVVSMSHYLEHTRDPESEIAAAAKILPHGGHLLIEVPDPECRFGRYFGSFWMPWFQPQHQHFLSAQNLDRLLRKHSFEAINWHRGEAHQPLDFVFALVLFLNRIAPPVDLPWRQPSSFAQKAWHKTIFFACLPILILARFLDKALAPVFRRAGWSNTYRVLARRLA